MKHLENSPQEFIFSLIINFRLGIRPLADGYEVKIDVNNMTLSILQSSPPFRSFAGELRRLSTIAYETFPCGVMGTNWKWYWEDNGNVWRTYDKDHSVSSYKFLTWLILVVEKIKYENKLKCVILF